ncbi:carnitine O-acetyltransferase-like isoform X2 [Dysidea avara]|uniref:carnitine O-acetyltransferase-like isoform X2 n=1 Tax=Dysidea avara TaxID=196820 RepID=UPI0033190FEA
MHESRMIFRGSSLILSMQTRGNLLCQWKSRSMVLAGLLRRTIVSYNPQGPKGDMLKHQSSLPKLPVPPLQQTLQKYLKAMRPLVNDSEYQKTLMVVEEFGKPNGVGEKLQRKLEERAKSHDNWLNDWWLHAAYLWYRESVLLNSNPSNMYTCPSVNQETYIHERIDVEKSKDGSPLCMIQYKDMLSCCRIPGEKVDTQRRSPIDQSRHITIAHNGHFFSLDVLWKLPDGSYTFVPVHHIEKELHQIMNSSPSKPQHPVGVLTTEHRDTWYKARERLMKDAVNKNSIDVIERSQFVLCLDPSHPGVSVHSDERADALSIVSNRTLHGNGTNDSSCNRWFDHGIQALISPDGYVGGNYEHSAADGTAGIQLIFYVLNNVFRESDGLLAHESTVIVPSQQLNPAQKLQWNISSETAKDIEVAKINLDNAVSDCDHQVFVFEDFGKEFMKSHRLSPDSFIQVAIQLAYYKMYGRLTSTYESGFTRLFLYGRTDTIRASSIESLAFCRAMLDPLAPADEKLRKLKVAVESHRQYTMEAVIGKAFDRHLLGLKLTAMEAGMETPSLFLDPSFAKCYHHSMSTSQMPAEFLLLCAFGAVVPDGYGVCYNPQNNRILYTVSTFSNCVETDTAQFGVKLMESLQAMKDVITC